MTGADVFGGTGGPTLGVMLPAFGALDGTIDPALVGEAAVAAEDYGLDGVWLPDHLVHPLPLLESIVTLEHVATATSGVHIGTAVLLLGLRKPIVAARQLATIAAYHPGRLTVGVGVGGEHPIEFRAAGVPLTERGARLAETVEQVRDLWTADPVVGHGRFADLDGVAIRPAPPKIPLLFGGHGRRALRRAARLGDAWVGFYKDVDGFAHARATLRDERHRLGLAGGLAGDFPMGMVLPTVLTDRTDPPDRALRRIADLMGGASTADFQSAPDRYVLAGTPERAAERIAEYHAAGCDHFVLALRDQGDAYREQLALVGEELLPAVRKLGG